MIDACFNSDLKYIIILKTTLTSDLPTNVFINKNKTQKDDF